MSSSSECTDTILGEDLITCSIYLSSLTNKFPVEEPINILTPQQPSSLVVTSKEDELASVAPK